MPLSTPFHNPKRQRGDPSLTLGLHRHHGIRCHTYEMVYLVEFPEPVFQHFQLAIEQPHVARILAGFPFA